jgi:TetR/AcrR family transcriptional regulator, regulator of cefoperazone and chloramphenicol sensitivity
MDININTISPHLNNEGVSNRLVHDIASARPKRIRDRSAKQRALVRAATGLFAQKGYEATPTREIAAAAGCAEGLIHRYFGGKAGLLSALIEDRAFAEVADLNQQLAPASRLEDEFLQLVEWEIDRMWSDREILRVLIPRALLDSSVAALLRNNSLGQRTQAMAERLRRFPGSERFGEDELDALAQTVGVLGFTFGFLRPVVLGQDRDRAKKIARTIAKLLVRP